MLFITLLHAVMGALLDPIPMLIDFGVRHCFLPFMYLIKGCFIGDW